MTPTIMVQLIRGEIMFNKTQNKIACPRYIKFKNAI